MKSQNTAHGITGRKVTFVTLIALSTFPLAPASTYDLRGLVMRSPPSSSSYPPILINSPSILDPLVFSFAPFVCVFVGLDFSKDCIVFFFGVVDIPTCRISRASTYLELIITIFSQHRPIQKISSEFLYASKILSTQRFTAPFQSADPGMV